MPPARCSPASLANQTGSKMRVEIVGPATAHLITSKTDARGHGRARRYHPVFGLSLCIPMSWRRFFSNIQPLPSGSLSQTARKSLKGNRFPSIVAGADLTASRLSSPTTRWGGLGLEQRQDAIRATSGFPAMEHVRPDRCALQWQPHGEDTALRNAVSGDGFCADNLSGKPTGYRGVSLSAINQALPHGFSRAHPTLHAS
jgi:hypothetical protein